MPRPRYPSDLTDAEWRAKLTPEEYRILRQAGTEPPWSGVVSVLPITSDVCSKAMSSSSHIIWRNAVPVPWPRSVLPT